MPKRLLPKPLCLLLLTAALCLLAAPCLAAQPAADALPGRQEIKAYFTKVVFDIEYGGENSKNILRRWEKPLRIKVYGSPTEEDLATLDRHIADLNQVDNMPAITRVDTEPNLSIYFVALNRMHNYIDGYVEGNWGFFWNTWSRTGEMIRAQIAIATDVTTQRQRNHLILEELTQSLGLMQDSNDEPDSIFYAPWTEVQQLSALDWKIIEMVYSPDVQAGMTLTEVLDVLGY